MLHPFAPQFGSTQQAVLGASGTSIKNIPGDCQVLRVLNVGAGDLYVRPYSSLQAVPPVASAVDYRVLPSTDRLIYVGDAMDRVSLFSIAGTTAEIMQGDGGISQ
jgi:hypothetical protein